MTNTTIEDQQPTSAGLEGIPLAETLDGATLRRVFAQAPADMAVARDVASMFRVRMRGLLGRPIVVIAFLAAVIVGASLGVAIGTPGWIALGVVVLFGIGAVFYEYSEASEDFFTSYAEARGLAYAEDSFISAGVPLFDKGDERKWPIVMSGTIAEQPATLGHYTYTVVTHDSEGKRQEHDHNFTVLHFSLPPSVAARFAGVYCSPRKLSLGALQDKLASDHKVELESAEFAKRYTLRAADTQDQVALYELFSTTFIQRLATELHAFWEQRGGDIVFWKQGHEKEAADLDRFCLESWHVLQRYLEEWQ